MKKRSYPLKNRIQVSFLLGTFALSAALLILFYFAFRMNFLDQQTYSLEQNYSQNYEGIDAMGKRMTELSRQLSTGSVLELQQVFRDKDASGTDFDPLTEYTDLLEFTMGDVQILYYVDSSLPVVHANGQHYRPIDEAYDQDWYGELMENNGRNVWFAFAPDLYRPDDLRLTLARSITDSSDYLSRIGVLVLCADGESIRRTLVPLAQDQLIYLEDAQGRVIASTDPELLGQLRLPQEYAGFVCDSYETVRLNGREALFQRRKVGYTGVYLVSVVPYSFLSDTLYTAVAWVFVFLVLFMLLSVLYIRVMGKRLTVPLTQLTERIGRAAREETRLAPIALATKEKEVLLLVEAYNRLIGRISTLLTEQYRLGEEKKQAELMALQSQINPHFLYNTLDMINWMAERGETKNVQEVILRTSQFYRLALSRGRDIVTIDEEIRLCEAYLAIQQKRFPGQIAYEKDVQEEVLGCRIPKITLQPLIENAIVHGINKSAAKRGTISLHGWTEDGRIILAVLDDGAGFSPDRPEESGRPSSGSHYGMKNIQTRLSVFFQENVKIEVESAPGEGTCVSLNLPMATSRENQPDRRDPG